MVEYPSAQAAFPTRTGGLTSSIRQYLVITLVDNKMFMPSQE
jgi:hypothetical protein